jgi:hypothetical protein
MKKFLTVVLTGFLALGCASIPPELNTPTQEPTESLEETAGGNRDTAKDRSWVTWDDCGGRVGDHACDFTFKDQNNADWSLYDHNGTLMLVDFSTMWCSVCNNIASKGDEFETKYAGRNFQWITVLIDDSSGGEVDLADVQAWVSAHSLNSTVLAGNRSIIDTTAADGYPISSWPTLVLIGNDMEILAGWHGWNESWVTTAIEQHLN